MAKQANVVTPAELFARIQSGKSSAPTLSNFFTQKSAALVGSSRAAGANFSKFAELEYTVAKEQSDIELLLATQRAADRINEMRARAGL